MQFEAVAKEAVILDPTRNMQPKRIPVEVRKDPLTGRTARVCHFRRLKFEKPDLGGMVAASAGTCPFCPERVRTATPCFPPEIAAEGRFSRGDKVLFPNLAPYDALGAVATLGNPHYLAMPDIEPQRIAEGILLAFDFFRRVQAVRHPESVYHLLSWNYMPASGSSLIHPHLQVFASSTPPNQLREELEAGRSYYHRTGRTYWDDLVQAEKEEGKRYLGTTGRVSWLSGYAPFGVVGDVIAVVADCRATLQLTESDVAELATGLTRVMAVYDGMGLYNFNLCFFPGTEADAFARFHLVFTPRIYYNPVLATPDATALRTLYNESICVGFPEDIATSLRPEFRL